MDTAIIVAALGLSGTVVVALIGMVVNLATNKTRVHTAAEEAVLLSAEKAQEDKEQALRERLLLRDEKIAALEEERDKYKAAADELRKELAKYDRR